MNYKKMVKEILQGSKNVDRMKKEIFSLTKIVLGLAKIYGPKKVMRETFESNTCKWVIARDEKGELYMQCEIHTIKGIWLIIFPGHNDICLDFVQEAFDGLPILIKGWLKRFPYSDGQIKSFLKASKVKF